jgi:cystathionine beta-lyase/cystathionine gamma-synthase
MPFPARYSYQRFDLLFQAGEWLKSLYNYPKFKNETLGMLLSSGMASINIIISALNALKIEQNLTFTKFPYFETYELISKYYQRIPQERLRKHLTHGARMGDKRNGYRFLVGKP